MPGSAAYLRMAFRPVRCASAPRACSASARHIPGTHDTVGDRWLAPAWSPFRALHSDAFRALASAFMAMTTGWHIQRTQQCQRAGIVQSVVDAQPFFSHLNQAHGSQRSELLGNVSLSPTGACGQMADALFLVVQQADQFQADGMRQRSAQSRRSKNGIHIQLSEYRLALGGSGSVKKMCQSDENSSQQKAGWLFRPARPVNRVGAVRG